MLEVEIAGKYFNTNPYSDQASNQIALSFQTSYVRDRRKMKIQAFQTLENSLLYIQGKREGNIKLNNEVNWQEKEMFPKM